MELKNVKLIEKLAVESGVTKSGKDWKKQLFVVEEVDTQYPKMIAMTAWNDTVDKLEAKKEGTLVNCGFRLESREYNGRWYTDAICFQIHGSEPKKSENTVSEAVPANDLPF